MPPFLSPLTFLGVACAVSAWWLARGSRRHAGSPRYYVVAALLAWGVVAGLCRAALQAWWLRPARAASGLPYGWPVRWAFHAERTLYLSWPAALLAAAAWAFTGRRPWPILAAWAALSAALALAYPGLRGSALAHVDAVVWSVVIAGVVACAVWGRHPVAQWGAAEGAILCLTATWVSVALVVLWWPHPSRDWGIARGVQQVGYCALLSYQVLKITRGR